MLGGGGVYAYIRYTFEQVIQQSDDNDDNDDNDDDNNNDYGNDDWNAHLPRRHSVDSTMIYLDPGERTLGNDNGLPKHIFSQIMDRTMETTTTLWRPSLRPNQEQDQEQDFITAT